MADESRVYTLKVEEELRIEVDFEKQLRVKLTKGIAECFGTELLLGKEYTFSGVKLAIFTWHGCEIQISGSYHHDYTATETPMSVYLNTHMGLEKLRETVSRQKIPVHFGSDGDDSLLTGPRVVLVGPTDVGKSSINRILLNYSVRAWRQPIYVELDVGQGDISIPGSIGALVMERVIDLEDEFSANSILSYFYGHVTPSDNIKLYKKVTTALAKAVDQKFEEDEKVRISGMMINTIGWVEGVGYELLQHVIETFRANVILVIGHERVYSELLKEFGKKSDVKVINLPKSGGVVTRDTKFRRRVRENKVKDYFYGIKKELFPHRIVVGLHEVEIYQVGQTYVAPSSALPIGEKSKIDETKCQRLTTLGSVDLSQAILGVSSLQEKYDPAQHDLLSYNLLGFVCVESADQNRLTLLSPAPGKLPGKYLLLGNLRLEV